MSENKLTPGENALAALIEGPDSCHEFLGATADLKIAYFKKIVQFILRT